MERCSRAALARRLGGPKAPIELRGRPLISYPLAAFTAAGIEPCRRQARHGSRPRRPRRQRAAEPRHPLLGIVAALDAADGRPWSCALRHAVRDRSAPHTARLVATRRQRPTTACASTPSSPVTSPPTSRLLRQSSRRASPTTSALEALGPVVIETDPASPSTSTHRPTSKRQPQASGARLRPWPATGSSPRSTTAS